MKRALSLVLVFIMILSFVPAVYAADTELDVTVPGLSVTHSDTMTWYGYQYGGQAPGGSNISWMADGNKIVAALQPGEMIQSCATLTFKNTLPITATLRFEYTLTNEENFSEVQDLEGEIVDYFVEMDLPSGDSFTIIAISPDPGYESTLTISGIALSTGSENVTATFKPAANGSYTVDGVQITEETSYETEQPTEYALSATPASGYQFFGWYNGSEYISHKAEDKIFVGATATIYPVFIANDVAVFGVGEKRFQDLAAADTYAQSSPVKTIVVMNDAVISGQYTISAGNTLLIPYDDANTVHTMATSTAVQKSESTWENVAWEKPNPYRTLTMAADSKLTVYGTLNVGGRHSAGPFLTAGSPSGDLGMIRMESGSNITLADRSQLYCWGYIYGNGTVTVKNGASVHENFQFTDFRGGNVTLGLARELMAFPVSQYYVQNVEVATTFEDGATEFVWGSIYLQGMVLGTSVKFIGNDNLSMFNPGVGGTVTKTYDPANDRLVIDVNGSGEINPMGLELGGQHIDTQAFVLPINSNMTININSGTTSLKQSLALLPGSKLNIAQGATLSLKNATPFRDELGNHSPYAGANNLIVYDRDQWFDAYKPVYTNSGKIVDADSIDAKFVYTNKGLKRLQPLSYSPSCADIAGKRTEANLVDAVVDINGLIDTEGFIYSTVDIDIDEYLDNKKLVLTGGGASVISSKGTGRLRMSNGSGPDNMTYQPIQTGDQHEYALIPMISAPLQNKDGSFVNTMRSKADDEYTYCADCGTWLKLKLSEIATHKVEVTWIVDGVEAPQEVCVGTKPVYNSGTDPVKTGYRFVGWRTIDDQEYTSATLPVATTDATYFACFEEEAQGMLGDFDLDGDVDASDLTLLARHVGKIEVLTGQALKNADVNGDKTVDSYDLTKHARYIGKIITDWNQE